jgi:hypothetical protein
VAGENAQEPEAEENASGAPYSPPEVAMQPTPAEVLGRAGVSPQPLNFNAEHQQRINEALVKQQETKADQADDDRGLRKKFAICIAAAVGLQIVAADVVFTVYGAANSWVIPGSTISAWLGATVVQVIAVATVIVRSLFPPPK